MKSLDELHFGLRRVNSKATRGGKAFECLEGCLHAVERQGTVRMRIERPPFAGCPALIDIAGMIGPSIVFFARIPIKPLRHILTLAQFVPPVYPIRLNSNQRSR